MAKKTASNDGGGILFTPARLYDADGKEIGVTNYHPECVAYAMAHSQRIVSAKTVNPLFGSEVIRRSDISKETLQKVRNKHSLGECLLFWIK